ncbi:MAG: glycosyl transferase, group 2 family, partial [Firmicutes bacterium]|nr:glycosyl transferase, group 2 family [Bacillota bacterium]
MNQRRPSFSLTMIVKNEEQNIGRCLDSVKNLVGEIIIVDTGSTDRTVEICRSYNAQIFSCPWQDNFAQARNFGLDKVSQDWVLWLDADEEIAPGNRECLNDKSLYDNYDALSVPL